MKKHRRSIKNRDYGRLYRLTRHDLLAIRKLRKEIRTIKWTGKETDSGTSTASTAVNSSGTHMEIERDVLNVGRLLIS